MGLDMYLLAEKHISGYAFVESTEREQYHSVLNTMEATDIADKDSPSADINVTAMYWRKQNAIHSWFVANVQDGNDNCKKHYVSREQLKELRDLCVQVTQDKENADSVLPTADGFFFGGTDYDDYYFEGIKETASRLTVLLNNTPEGWVFNYQSSW
jgi:hypothetical protein